MKSHKSSDNPLNPQPSSSIQSKPHQIDGTSQLDDLTQLFDSAPVGLCLMDTELRFIRINDHLAKINGVSIDEHIGKTLREVIPEVASIVEPYYRKVIDTGMPILDVEVQGRTQAME